jgi:hypothetical protein
MCLIQNPCTMNKIIVILCLIGLCTNQTAFGQKRDVEAVETYMDLRPLEVSVIFKKDTFYFFLTFEQGQSNMRSWKLLVSKDEKLLPALQKKSFSGTAKFQSVRFTKKGHRKLWRRATKKFNIDRFNVEPYAMYEIFNTNALQ